MKLEVIRSKRRRKTVSGSYRNGTFTVHIPATLPDSAAEQYIVTMIERLENRLHNERPTNSDLETLAEQLNRLYFGGTLTYSIAWSERQRKRWGSCTLETHEIRISTLLMNMPRFVQAYVIMHELAHLVHGNHSPQYWKLVNRYPLTAKAQGYLMGWSQAQNTDTH